MFVDELLKNFDDAATVRQLGPDDLVTGRHIEVFILPERLLTQAGRWGNIKDYHYETRVLEEFMEGVAGCHVAARSTSRRGGRYLVSCRSLITNEVDLPPHHFHGLMLFLVNGTPRS